MKRRQIRLLLAGSAGLLAIAAFVAWSHPKSSAENMPMPASARPRTPLRSSCIGSHNPARSSFLPKTEALLDAAGAPLLRGRLTFQLSSVGRAGGC